MYILSILNVHHKSCPPDFMKQLGVFIVVLLSFLFGVLLVSHKIVSSSISKSSSMRLSMREVGVG